MDSRLTLLEIRRRALRAAAAAAGLSLVGTLGACDSPASTPTFSAADNATWSTDSGRPASGDANPGSPAADTAPSDVVLADAGTAGADAATAGGSDAAPAADAAQADTAQADGAAGPLDVAGSDSGATGSDAAVGDGGADALDPCHGQEPDKPVCLALQGKPEWGTCCETLGTWCQQAHPGNDQAANVCVFGENFSGACTGCIPWGPPAPPPFDEAWRPEVRRMGAVFGVA